MAQYARLKPAVGFLVGAVLFGMAGYVLIEGWSLFDAFYMSIVTLSTVGFGEIHPLSHAGRVFTIFFILLGRGAETYLVIVVAQVLVVEPLRDVLGRRRMEQELGRISDHYIVCGWGRMGKEIVEQIRRKGSGCVVVELSEENCRLLAEQQILHVHGDASDDAVLRAAGVDRARGLICVAPRDADNIFITLSARALNRKLLIVARSITGQDVHKLEIAGADRVISPYVIGARRMAAALFHPGVVDFLDLEVRHEELEWELDDLTIEAASPLAGKTLGEIRDSAGCTVLAVRQGQTRAFTRNPGVELRPQPGDTLICLGTPEQLEALRRIAGQD
jgi:voltage-gated potassium channel